MKKILLSIVVSALSISCFAQLGGEGSMKPVPRIPMEEDKISEIEAMMIDGNFCLTARYDERDKWAKALSASRAGTAVKSAEKFLAEDGTCNMVGWDPSWVEKYWSPKKNNDTNTGKKMHGKRQHTLTSLVFGECIEGKGRFVPAINDCLRKVVRGFWVMPRNYKPQEKVQDIELGANHYSSVVGQTLYIMGDKIEPELRQEALDTLYSRVFNPMISSFQPGAKRNFCSWATSRANWNTACLSGILSAALACIPDKHTRAVFVYLSDRYVDNYPSGYTPDGYCTEGMSYYNYGFDKYYYLREMIRAVTGGKIDIFTRCPYLAEMMSYPFKLQLYSDLAPSKNIYPAFGDCSSGTRPSSNIVYYNNKYLGMNLHSLSDYDPRTTSGGFMGGGMTMFNEYAGDSSSSAEPLDPLRSLFKDCGILTCRPAPDEAAAGKKASGLSVAIKGGHNQEAHNHNDVGSYGICLDGVFLVEDPGIAPYTGKTFGSQRYTIRTINSYGHSCPTVDDVLQATVGTKAPVLRSDFTDAEDDFALELKDFYKEAGDITSIRRSYSYLRNKEEFIVTDEFSAGSGHLWGSSISTRSEVKVNRNTIIFTRNEKTLKATVKSTVPVKIETEVIEGPDDAKVPFTRIGIKTVKSADSCRISVDFKVI